METIANLQANIDAIKDTPSTKVEWNATSGSMKSLVNTLKNLILERGVATAFTIDELKAFGPTETRYVNLYNQASSTGLYSYRNPSSEVANNTTSFDAAGGGLWKRAELPSI